MFSKSLIERLEESVEQAKRSYSWKAPVVFIDGTNMFIRGFCAANATNRKGQHIGGIQGFLKSLGKVCKMFNPSRVVILFDGEGGSIFRRNLYPQYKMNRDREKLMNPSVFFTRKEELESHTDQMLRLIEYLKCLPVTMVCQDMVEADDVLGWLTNWIRSKSEKYPHIIVSSDRDYLQLVNEWRAVYNAKDDIFYDIDRVIEKYSVSPVNFLLYRCLIGDVSDNVSGVPGVAHKTAIKLFPQLIEESPVTIDDLVMIAESENEKKKPQKIWQKVIDSKDHMHLIHGIMKLGEHPFTEIEQEEILNQLKMPRKRDEYEFARMSVEDELDFTDALAWIDKNFSTLK